MADMTIDEATLDTQVTGGELLPASDGGNPRAVSTEKIKDYVLAKIAELTESSSVDASQDGVYLLKGGELKPVSASVLAAAIMDYAFALSSVVTINGNEKLPVKDNGTKKTLTLDKVRTWILGDISSTPLAEHLAAMQNNIDAKVESVDGMGLSSNDYTNEEKSKLAGLVGNVQGDWDETDASQPSFIKNKPTIPEGTTVDRALDDQSQNAIANDVVATRFEAIAQDLSEQDDAIEAVEADVAELKARVDEEIDEQGISQRISELVQRVEKDVTAMGYRMSATEAKLFSPNVIDAYTEGGTSGVVDITANLSQTLLIKGTALFVVGVPGASGDGVATSVTIFDNNSNKLCEATPSHYEQSSDELRDVLESGTLTCSYEFAPGEGWGGPYPESGIISVSNDTGSYTFPVTFTHQ